MRVSRAWLVVVVVGACVAGAPSALAAGNLTYGGCQGETSGCVSTQSAPAALDGANDVAITPDGANVYVAASGSGTVSHFIAQPAGPLTFAGCWGDAKGCQAVSPDSLQGVESIAIAKNNLYLGGDGAVTHFHIDTKGGLIYSDCIGSVAGCATPAVGTALDNAFSLAVSSAGVVYVAKVDRDTKFPFTVIDGALSELSLDPSSHLTFQGCVGDLTGCTTTKPAAAMHATGLAISPDATQLYVGGGRDSSVGNDGGHISHLALDPSGAPTYADCIGDLGGCQPTDPAQALDGGEDSLAVAPDGQHVYALASVPGNPPQSALSVLGIDGAGGLTFGSCFGTMGGCKATSAPAGALDSYGRLLFDPADPTTLYAAGNNVVVHLTLDAAGGPSFTECAGDLKGCDSTVPATALDAIRGLAMPSSGLALYGASNAGTEATPHGDVAIMGASLPLAQPQPDMRPTYAFADRWGFSAGQPFTDRTVREAKARLTIHPSTRSPRACQDVKLRAAATAPRGHRILGYRWDLNGDGVWDDAYGARVDFDPCQPGRNIASVQTVDDTGRITTTVLTLRTHGTALPNPARAVAGRPFRPGLTGGFSGGLGGWLRVGGAFSTQRTSVVSGARQLDAAGRLGGSYSNFAIRLRSKGGWVSSFAPSHRLAGLSQDANGDAAVGELISSAFTLRRYLSFRLGGHTPPQAPASERLEVWVRNAKGRYAPISSLTRSAGDLEALTQYVLTVPKNDVGRRAVIALIDASSAGHVNLDEVHTANRISSGALGLVSRNPAHWPAPLIGFGDFHTHLMGHQSFGGLDGIRTYMGVPGGAAVSFDSHGVPHDVYAENPSLYYQDVGRDQDTLNPFHLPPISSSHFGGLLSPFVEAVLAGKLGPAEMANLGRLVSRLTSSNPDFIYVVSTLLRGIEDGTVGRLVNELFADVAHPAAFGPAHEQMHITELHRAWEGGLRMISSLAVNNAALQYAMSPVRNCLHPGDSNVDLTGAPAETNPPASDDCVHLSSDRQVIEAGVLATRELAQLNSSWMEIAYSPADLYRIVSEGKLAVILGAEVDDIGHLVSHPGPIAGTDTYSAQENADYLWRLGVRQLILTHAITNSLGGNSIFEDVYNTTNDLLTRPRDASGHPDRTENRVIDDSHDHGLGVNPGGTDTSPGPHTPLTGYFYHVRLDDRCTTASGDPSVPFRDETNRGYCVAYTLNPSQGVIAIGSTVVTGAFPTSHSVNVEPYYFAGRYRGDRNRLGLSDYGRSFVHTLMTHGMVIDMDHASDLTIDGLISDGQSFQFTSEGLGRRGPLWDFLPAGHGPCSPHESLGSSCWQYMYPIMSSHSQQRAQSLFPGVTTDKDFMPSENDRTPLQIRYIRASGGVVGPVSSGWPRLSVHDVADVRSNALTYKIIPGVDAPIDSSVPNDCSGSSKSFAQSYLYDLQKMGGSGVGLGTDMILVGGMGPRFGRPGFSLSNPNDSTAGHVPIVPGCPAWLRAPDPQREKDANNAAGLHQYDTPQANPVDYTSPFAPLPGSPTGHTPLRQELRPNGQRGDFNAFGLNYYGLLPDMLQDLANDGVSENDLAPLFSSVDSYYQMWSKAYHLAGCDKVRGRAACYPGLPAFLSPSVCANTCPLSFERGMGEDPSGRRFAFNDASLPSAGPGGG